MKFLSTGKKMVNFALALVLALALAPTSPAYAAGGNDVWDVVVEFNGADIATVSNVIWENTENTTTTWHNSNGSTSEVPTTAFHYLALPGTQITLLTGAQWQLYDINQTVSPQEVFGGLSALIDDGTAVMRSGSVGGSIPVLEANQVWSLNVDNRFNGGVMARVIVYASPDAPDDQPPGEPAVTLPAEIAPTPWEVMAFIELITNRVAHVSFTRTEWFNGNPFDTPRNAHAVFVREGAMLTESDNWWSGLFHNFGYSDLQFDESFFSGNINEHSFSLTIDDSPVFHTNGYEYGTLNNFVEMPLSLSQLKEVNLYVGLDGEERHDILIIVVDETTAAQISGGRLPAPTPVPTPTASSSGQPSQREAEDVSNAIALGLVPQNLQGQYAQPITRAEFAALAVALYETMMGSEITERETFNDTTDINVQKIGGLGVVTGVGGGNFAPDGTITREQAAVMLDRLVYAMGFDLNNYTIPLSDNDEISPWAAESIGRMIVIMDPVDDTRFAPKDMFTREQSIVTIMILYEYLGYLRLE